MHKLLVVCLLALFCFGCEGRHKNTIYLGTGPVRGLDPVFAEDGTSAYQVTMGYEPLLQYNYLKRPFVIEPLLLESAPLLTNGGKTYIFQLKKGVLFHDDPCFVASKGKGRELTAEDVVFTFLRIADPKTPPGAWWLLDKKIQGLNEWREHAKSGQANYQEPVAGLKALDRYRFQITLTKPYAPFLYALAMGETAIVAHEAVNYYGADFYQHVVGTGPYRLVKFDPNTTLVWEKNPHYRKEVYPANGEAGDKERGLLADAGKTLPLNERVEYSIFSESQPYWLNFLAQKIDLASVPKDPLAEVLKGGSELNQDLQKKKIALHRFNPFVVDFVSMNMSDPLLGKNKFLRQALSLAIDGNAFTQLFCLGGTKAESFVPPGLVGADGSVKSLYRKFDLSLAKQKLATAGYPGGKGLPILDIATLADTSSRQSAEFFQKSFATIGVNTKISTYTYAQYIKFVQSKSFQIWVGGDSADYPDAEEFFMILLSRNVSPGTNETNYTNKKFDALYEASLVATAEGKSRLYHEMNAILNEDMPLIPLCYEGGLRAVQPWLKNYKPNPFALGEVKYWRLER